MKKLLTYLCIAAANNCKYIEINGNRYDLPKDKTPEYRFTGNLYNRFPALNDFDKLPENRRISIILTPIQKSWYFEYEGKPFNFYPLFLYMSHLNICGVQEYTPTRKLSLYEIHEIQRNYSPLTV